MPLSPTCTLFQPQWLCFHFSEMSNGEQNSYRVICMLLRICWTVFYKLLPLKCCWEHMKILITLLPHLWLFFVFLIAAILVDMKRDLTVAILCISIITNDVKHLPKCLLSIYVFSLDKYLFKSLVIFSIFYHWTVIILYIFWTQVLYQIHDL